MLDDVGLHVKCQNSAKNGILRRFPSFQVFDGILMYWHDIDSIISKVDFLQKKYPDILSSFAYKRSYTHQQLQNRCTSWGFLCLVFCWVGTLARNGISHHVTRYHRCPNWRFLAGRSAGRHSRSRSWRSEVTKNHWLFCAPWQEHDKHPIQDCCTKSIMSVSRLLTFSRTPAAVWIGCLVLLQRCFAKEHLAYPPILWTRGTQFLRNDKGTTHETFNLSLESLRALFTSIEMIECALNSEWLV